MGMVGRRVAVRVVWCGVRPSAIGFRLGIAGGEGHDVGVATANTAITAITATEPLVLMREFRILPGHGEPASAGSGLLTKT